MSQLHPCQKCGACCAYFRVAFYWLEAEPLTEPHVPTHLTAELDLRTRCMKGTEKKHHPKCVALEGEIGKSVACTIYSQRPTPCRRFQASYEHGQQEIRCDEARKKHGLRPLNKSDWDEFYEKEVQV